MAEGETASSRTFHLADPEDRIRLLWLSAFNQKLPPVDFLLPDETQNRSQALGIVETFYHEHLNRPATIFQSRGLNEDQDIFNFRLWKKFLREMRARADAIDSAKSSLALVYLHADPKDDGDLRNVLLDSLFAALGEYLYFKPKMWPQKSDQFGVRSPAMSDMDLIHKTIIAEKYRAYDERELFAVLTERHPVFPFILAAKDWETIWKLYWSEADPPTIRTVIGEMVQTAIDKIQVSGTMRAIANESDFEHLVYFRPAMKTLLEREYPIDQLGNSILHQIAMEDFKMRSGSLPSDRLADLNMALSILGLVVTISTLGTGSILAAVGGTLIGLSGDVLTIMEYHAIKDENNYIASLGVNPYLDACFGLAQDPKNVDKIGYALSVFSLMSVLKKPVSRAVLARVRAKDPRPGANPTAPLAGQAPPNSLASDVPPSAQRSTAPSQKATSRENQGLGPDPAHEKPEIPAHNRGIDVPEEVTRHIESEWMAEELATRRAMLEHKMVPMIEKVGGWQDELNKIEKEMKSLAADADKMAERASKLRDGHLERRWRQSTRDRKALELEEKVESLREKIKSLDERKKLLTADIDRVQEGLQKYDDLIRWNKVAADHILGTRNPNRGFVVEAFFVPRVAGGSFSMVRYGMPAIDGVVTAGWGERIRKVIQSKISFKALTVLDDVKRGAAHGFPEPYKMAEAIFENALEDARSKLKNWDSAAEKLAEDKIFGLLPATHQELDEFRLLIVIPTRRAEYGSYDLIKRYIEAMVDPKGQIKNLVVDVQFIEESEISRLISGSN